MEIPKYKIEEIIDNDLDTSDETANAVIAVTSAFRKKIYGSPEFKNVDNELSATDNAILEFAQREKRLPDIDDKQDYEKLLLILQETLPGYSERQNIVTKSLENWGRIERLQRTLREKMIKIWKMEKGFADALLKESGIPFINDDFQDTEVLHHAILQFKEKEHRDPDPNDNEDIRDIIIIYTGLKNRC